MKVMYTDGPATLSIHGGFLKRDEPKDIDSEIAYDLAASGRAVPADDDAWVEYATIRKGKVEAAAKKGGTIYCDECHQEVDATNYQEAGCVFCGSASAEE